MTKEKRNDYRSAGFDKIPAKKKVGKDEAKGSKIVGGDLRAKDGK